MNHSDTNSVGHSPGREPLQMLPLSVASFHTEADSPEQPEEANDDTVKNRVEAPLRFFPKRSSKPIDAESRSEDGKV